MKQILSNVQKEVKVEEVKIYFFNREIKVFKKGRQGVKYEINM